MQSFLTRWFANLKPGGILGAGATGAGAVWALLDEVAPTLPVDKRACVIGVGALLAMFFYFLNPKDLDWMPKESDLSRLVQGTVGQVLSGHEPITPAGIEKAARAAISAEVKERLYAMTKDGPIVVRRADGAKEALPALTVPSQQTAPTPPPQGEAWPVAPFQEPAPAPVSPEVVAPVSSDPTLDTAAALAQIETLIAGIRRTAGMGG